MGVTDKAKTFARDKALEYFEDVISFALGSDATSANKTQTGLLNEQYRALIEEKQLTSNTWEFTMRVPITEYNNTTLRELAMTTNNSTGGEVSRDLFDQDFTKSYGSEFLITLEIGVNIT